MSEKTEIRIAKFIATIIISLTLFMSTRANAGEIADLFKHYNHKLSQKQALNLESIVKEAGKSFEVSPYLIASIIVIESSARQDVISKGGDYGLMQVRWKVHRKSYPKLKQSSDLLEPHNNIFIGTQIFAQYYKQKGTVYKALVRYSGGNKNMAHKVLNIFNKLVKEG